MKHAVQIINNFTGTGVKPTIRAVFYQLLSADPPLKIKKTDTDYRNLCTHLVWARKQGLIDWDAFSDEGRMILACPPEKIEPEDYIQSHIFALKNADKEYSYPRWIAQSEYVEVWIEKLALAGTFESILKDKQVCIVVNRGYSSWTFFYQNAYRIYNKIIDLGGSSESVHILYFGDMDIDGEHMDEHIKEMIRYFQDANQGEADIEGIDFQRVSLTDEQIKKHKIPTKTIEQTRNNKKRLADYQRRHGHRQAAELDAFLAVDNGLPFKKVVLDAVGQFFDQEQYEKYQLELQEERKGILRLVHKKVVDLYKDLS